MIRYDKRWWGLPLLIRMYGSALPRTVPFVFVSAALTLVLELTVGKRDTSEDVSTARSWWEHPYPFQTFAFIVGFMLVFRSNFGYSRYWEGRTNLQLMTSKWTDAAIQCLRFESCTLPEGSSEEAKQASRLFQENIIHLISLLHGVAVQNLRKDWVLKNLVPHDATKEAPPVDAMDVMKMHKGTTWWLSWKTLTQLGSSECTRQDYYKFLPIHVIDGVTEDEIESLSRYIPDSVDALETANSDGPGVPGPEELVQVVSSWIHQLIIERRKDGGLGIEPPIMTRVYQVLSEGMQGFEQCRKISDTPFPFPWAQFVAVCLLVYALTIPVLISSYVTDPLLAVVLDVISVVTYYVLNEVARDLEDPFLYDPNDLPLATYQFNFNKRLLAVHGTSKPMTPAEARPLSHLHVL